MEDQGMILVTRELDDMVTIRVRSPNDVTCSVVKLPFDVWARIAIPPMLAASTAGDLTPLPHRPVAFRVKVGEAWTFCPTEDEARRTADYHGAADYQGLYIRDNPHADAERANAGARFSTAWEREDYERRQRGEPERGPLY